MINELKGQIFTHIAVNNDKTEMYMTAESGSVYTFYHSQDCCEDVFIADITGDLIDLIGSPLLKAECIISDMSIDDLNNDAYTKNNIGYKEGKWTFYKFATRKGYVDIRWCGMSNGWYSVEVDLKKD